MEQEYVHLVCSEVTRRSFLNQTYSRIVFVDYYEGIYAKVYFTNNPVDDTLIIVHIFGNGNTEEYRV